MTDVAMVWIDGDDRDGEIVSGVYQMGCSHQDEEGEWRVHHYIVKIMVRNKLDDSTNGGGAVLPTEWKKSFSTRKWFDEKYAFGFCD